LNVLGLEICESCEINKYQKLKDEFEKKLYFTKKLPFPNSINNIGILTSVEGAALKDVLYVLNEGGFNGNIYIKNCLAQGLGCPSSVKDGILYFTTLNKTTPIDILLVTRGGGGMEDLMGYSSEEVVKSLYETNLFTISAIGHEIDTMLSDLAADYRAPTPSIAGELIIKLQNRGMENLLKVSNVLKHLEYMILSKLNLYESKLHQINNNNKLKNPNHIINLEIRRLSEIDRKLKEHIDSNIIDVNERLNKLRSKNNIHDTIQLLNTGYSIVIDENNNLIDDLNVFKKNIQNKKELKIIFKNGEIRMSGVCLKI
jgi:exodeoxyribonuclease VII large subunit